MNQSNLLFAADIEALVEDFPSFTRNELLSWQDILQRAGEKESPTICDGGQYHNDGYPLEWAFEPSASPSEFLEKDMHIRRQVETRFSIKLFGYDWFDTPELDEFDRATHYLSGHCMRLGCSPDFYMGRERRLVGKARAVRTRPLREAGLHFHLNLRPEYANDAEAVIPIIDDLYEATKVWHTWSNPNTRPWYRQPKCYRPKPYGVEYRSIGSSVINDDGSYAMLVRTVFDFMKDHWKLGGYVV